MLVYVIGAPGSGKGTICKKWCAETSFEHLSIGDLLRKLVKHQTGIAQHILDRVLNNELLHIDDLLPIIKDKVARLEADGHTNVVIDGFPRTADQIDAMGKAIGKPSWVLYFECPADIAKHRYQKRCLPGRDDNPMVFDKRYTEFITLNDEVVHRFTQEGILLKVDTSGDPDTSYANLLRVLGSTDLPGSSSARGANDTLEKQSRAS